MTFQEFYPQVNRALLDNLSKISFRRGRNLPLLEHDDAILLQVGHVNGVEQLLLLRGVVEHLSMHLGMQEVAIAEEGIIVVPEVAMMQTMPTHPTVY